MIAGCIVDVVKMASGCCDIVQNHMAGGIVVLPLDAVVRRSIDAVFAQIEDHNGAAGLSGDLEAKGSALLLTIIIGYINPEDLFIVRCDSRRTQSFLVFDSLCAAVPAQNAVVSLLIGATQRLVVIARDRQKSSIIIYIDLMIEASRRAMGRAVEHIQHRAGILIVTDQIAAAGPDRLIQRAKGQHQVEDFVCVTQYAAVCDDEVIIAFYVSVSFTLFPELASAEIALAPCGGEVVLRSNKDLLGDSVALKLTHGTLVGLDSNKGHSAENADNGNHDQQFRQREALSVFPFFPRFSGVVRLCSHMQSPLHAE